MPDTSTDVKQTWILEMRTPAELRPKGGDRDDLEVRQVLPVCPEFNWFLHQAVGVEYRWGGRENWRDAEWTEYASRPDLQTWVGYLGGTPTGYFEIEKQADGSVHIQCFGLLRRFFGAGIGGRLLTVCVLRSWDLGANRVWLSTCSHDHPHALQNYQARGFRIVEERAGPANRPRPSVIYTSGIES
jgi:ribosomal protein S18 acetylase RimI-like enzyme